MQILAQPVMRMDGMQRMAMMMTMLVLGSPQIYGCRAHEVQEFINLHGTFKFGTFWIRTNLGKNTGKNGEIV
jgi:hypothetical protein